MEEIIQQNCIVEYLHPTLELLVKESILAEEPVMLVDQHDYWVCKIVSRKHPKFAFGKFLDSRPSVFVNKILGRNLKRSGWSALYVRRDHSFCSIQDLRSKFREEKLSSGLEELSEHFPTYKFGIQIAPIVKIAVYAKSPQDRSHFLEMITYPYFNLFAVIVDLQSTNY